MLIPTHSLKQESSLLDSNRVVNLIRTYQRLGIFRAKLDPVNIPNEYQSISLVELKQKMENRLSLEYHGFTSNDLEKEFIVYTENIEVILCF